MPRFSRFRLVYPDWFKSRAVGSSVNISALLFKKITAVQITEKFMNVKKKSSDIVVNVK